MTNIERTFYRELHKYIFSDIYLDKIPVEPEKEMVLEDGEIVKPFPDCDRYLVSNYGRIWSKPKGDWTNLGSNPKGWQKLIIKTKISIIIV